MPAEARLPKPWRHPVFHKMRVRIEELEEENRQLREQIVPPTVFPHAWRVNGQQARFLATLYASRRPVTRNVVRSAIARFDAEHDVSDKHLDIIAFRLREKLRPFGVDVVTVWGVGFTLTPSGRATIREALDAIAAGRLA